MVCKVNIALLEESTFIGRNVPLGSFRELSMQEQCEVLPAFLWVVTVRQKQFPFDF